MAGPLANGFELLTLGDGDGAIEGYNLQEASCPGHFAPAFIPQGCRCKKSKSLGAARGNLILDKSCYL